MKKLLLILAIPLLTLLTAGTSYASYGDETCQPIYGGGTSCEVTNKFVLDKKVLNPSSSGKGGVEVFVDNLSINDPKYAPLQTVKFQLTATNTGNNTLSELTLKDILPNFVDFVSGPGTYDPNTRTLTLKIFNLNPNESRQYTIETKVSTANSLPAGQGVDCVVNQASLIMGTDESKDNSQFCIEKPTTKGGLPIMQAPTMTKTPPTGPEMLPLFGLIPAGLGGLLLRKKSSK